MKQNQINRKKRHWKILKRIKGTPEKPRVMVYKSLQNLYVQAIDDLSGKVICGMSTNSKNLKSKVSYGGNVAAAKELGKVYAGVLKEKGVQTIAFDRAGFLFHGRIKAFADVLREEGIQF